MSMHTDDDDVSVTSMNSFVMKVFDENEHFKLIKETINISVLC